MNRSDKYQESTSEERIDQVMRSTSRETIGESETTTEKIKKGMHASAIAISNKEIKIGNGNYENELTRLMMEGVHELPEKLALHLGTVDPAPYLQEAFYLRQQIEHETDNELLSRLQQKLIFQYMAIISRVQNGGEKGITPSVAEEVHGIDCSMSTWCLKEKLQGVPRLDYKFGFPSGHAIGIVTLANGQTMYIDAQNGFMSAVELQEAEDENVDRTAYPLYEITKSQSIECELPNEGIVRMTRPDGCDYLPKYLGVREDGLLHTMGNFHMFTNPTSPIFFTKAARQFRRQLGIVDHDQGENEAPKYVNECNEAWERFDEGTLKSIAKGATIYETKFGEMAQSHHDEWQAEQVRQSLNM